MLNCFAAIVPCLPWRPHTIILSNMLSEVNVQGDMVEWEWWNLEMVLVGLFLYLRFLVVVEKVHGDSPPGTGKL